MKNYGKYRTFTEQINYNSSDYCVAYTQCEVAYYAKTSSTVQNGKEVDKKVEERADDVRDNKPATMAEISLMMDKYGIKLKIVNDENYQRTQEEIDNGIEVIYVEKGSKDDKNADQVGHAYYIDANGNRFDVETKLNNCFYGIFSKILETKGINKSIENIRNELADDIKSNANYSKVMEAEKWIHNRHPQEANSLLFSAGLRLVPSASYRQDGVTYEQLQEKKRQNQNLTEEEEKFIENYDRQQQDQARYEQLKEKKRQNQNLTKEEEMLIKDYESKGHLEVEPKDLSKLNYSVHNTKDRGKPHDAAFKVSVLIVFFS
ncbi:unnamed protein product [Rotaria sp. Silwood2]|nr:unnamed protein product [Rotaria sp. Silwood2]